ncbi:hypothetical protein GCM10023311_04750 [Flaviramulus aquimarinus]|uniref:Peptidase S74 domain-containing protein n=1 Tax=Flaviramulus aquimarinus TaxID=1170456 RepID=A0ABP9ET00_9FLAO
MKHILTVGLFLFIAIKTFAQTDGISYQAVIIGPDVLELPGVDSEGNILPVTTVAIRFTIFDSGNQVEFQEVQITDTDEFGRINLIIGAVEHDAFEKISWDGTAKDLKVDIDFEGGSSFVDMSREVLTFVPYAYHRNITATGTLDVDGNTLLNGELLVESPTTLNSTLEVAGGNETNLTGPLTVDGETNLNQALNVNGQSATSLSGALSVGEDIVAVEGGTWDDKAPTKLNGTLDVVGLTNTNGLSNKGSFRSDVLEGLVLNITSTTDEDRFLDNGTGIGQTSILKGNTTIGSDISGTYPDKITVNGNVGISTQDDLNITTSQQVKIISTVHTDAISYGTSTDPEGLAITTTEDNPGLVRENYPLSIEGSTQGIAIKVIGERRNGNNFIGFWDNDGMWGRIEGEIAVENNNDTDYTFDIRAMAYDVYDAELRLGFAIASEVLSVVQLATTYADYRPCVGFGACSLAPGPADIGFAIYQVVSDGLQIAFAADALIRTNDNEDIYAANKANTQGVTYASGSGDYAEYLLRADVNENITYGDVVGVKGGKVSKTTAGAERMMVVSFKPIVLGNMPQPNRENEYEKVAFMGQVPVKVFGKVNIGDYIVPSGNNDGLGIGISPSQITSKHIENIVGIAWEQSDIVLGVNMINVAVGLNENDNTPLVKKLKNQVEQRDLEINNLKKQVNEIYKILSKIEDSKNTISTDVAFGHPDDEKYDDRRFEVIETAKGEVIYWEMTKEDFEEGLQMAERLMLTNGVDLESNVLWKKIKSEPDFKSKTFEALKIKLENEIHYHHN